MIVVAGNKTPDVLRSATRAEGKGLEGPAGIFSTRFGSRDTESCSCKDLALEDND